MPGVPITYRTTDDTKWGAGAGADLDAPDIDNNFWELQQAILALQATRPQPNNIASVSREGTLMVMHLDDGTTLTIPLPVLQYRDRGAWAPNTDYKALDLIRVEGKGIYSALLDHTSGLDFDENAVDGDSNPLWNKLIGSDAGAGSSSIYGIEFYYPGKLSDVTATYLWQMVSLQNLTIQAGGHNVAYLQTPAAGSISLECKLNDAHVGQINFPSGSNLGVVLLDTDVSVNRDDRFAVAPPASADAAAAGLTVGFPAVLT